uniref:Uncharacterized protein n=1 Tax=Chromera velia CCMP2878 TaxID=1169474 RepID=A0A0G4FXS8_9ALVE|eukprot:Cvel_19317.t1-p1 / transcript=Cvel_19317.t1 / gene=Cvel_19317 / organism=Chromera_velia_CCMP2878 / gene_product=hypothetical protein / transcript_product=hypothetical protein / location=Cvel_scaffold1656:5312-12450(+) / protein_length=972 / sequence_SO=supercontig / SO=protein_coding / is_pseudo=false
MQGHSPIFPVQPFVAWKQRTKCPSQTTEKGNDTKCVSCFVTGKEIDTIPLLQHGHEHVRQVCLGCLFGHQDFGTEIVEVLDVAETTADPEWTQIRLRATAPSGVPLSVADTGVELRFLPLWGRGKVINDCIVHLNPFEFIVKVETETDTNLSSTLEERRSKRGLPSPPQKTYHQDVSFGTISRRSDDEGQSWSSSVSVDVLQRSASLDAEDAEAPLALRSSGWSDRNIVKVQIRDAKFSFRVALVRVVPRSADSVCASARAFLLDTGRTVDKAQLTALLRSLLEPQKTTEKGGNQEGEAASAGREEEGLSEASDGVQAEGNQVHFSLKGQDGQTVKTLCRTTNCTHLQDFDLDAHIKLFRVHGVAFSTYLVKPSNQPGKQSYDEQLKENIRACSRSILGIVRGRDKWSCPICTKPARLWDLLLDQGMQELLVASRPKHHSGALLSLDESGQASLELVEGEEEDRHLTPGDVEKKARYVLKHGPEMALLTAQVDPTALEENENDVDTGIAFVKMGIATSIDQWLLDSGQLRGMPKLERELGSRLRGEKKKEGEEGSSLREGGKKEGEEGNSLKEGGKKEGEESSRLKEGGKKKKAQRTPSLTQSVRQSVTEADRQERPSAGPGSLTGLLGERERGIWKGGRSSRGCSREKERERDRDTHGERPRDRERDRGGRKDRDGERPRDKERDRGGGRDRDGERPRDRERDRGGGKDRDGERPRDRERDRGVEKDREKEKEKREQGPLVLRMNPAAAAQLQKGGGKDQDGERPRDRERDRGVEKDREKEKEKREQGPLVLRMNPAAAAQLQKGGGSASRESLRGAPGRLFQAAAAAGGLGRQQGGQAGPPRGPGLILRPPSPHVSLQPSGQAKRGAEGSLSAVVSPDLQRRQPQQQRHLQQPQQQQHLQQPQQQQQWQQPQQGNWQGEGYRWGDGGSVQGWSGARGGFGDRGGPVRNVNVRGGRGGFGQMRGGRGGRWR